MTDLDGLRAALDRAWALPFPEHPDADELEELMDDLVELDGFIVGIGVTVLGGGTASYRITGLQELEERFGDVRPVSPRDARILQECHQILAYLREITEAIRAS